MSDSIAHLLQLLYFMLPAYAANMAPPFVRYWHGWNPPIHARLLGAHKTVLGFALGVAASVLTTAAQSWIDASLALVDYSHWLLLGLAFGFGAMAGDSVQSLLKRRLGRSPGAPWIPFDQLDFAISALLLVGWYAALSWMDIVAILVITLIGDILVNRLSFRLGIKDTPW